MPKHFLDFLVADYFGNHLLTTRAVNWFLILLGVLPAAWATARLVDSVVADGDASLFPKATAFFASLVIASASGFYHEVAIRRPRLSENKILATTTGPAGVAIPLHRRNDMWAIFAHLATASALGAGAAAAPRAVTPLLAGFALLFVVQAAIRVRALSVPHRVTITLDGVSVENGKKPSFLAWEEIRDSGWAPGSRWGMDHFFFGANGPLDRPRVPTARLDLDPLLLGHALTTYRLHPELRSELTTGAVRSRLLDPDFAFSSTPKHIWKLSSFRKYSPLSPDKNRRQSRTRAELTSS